MKDAFFENIKKRYLELGLDESLATAVAKIIKVSKREDKIIIGECQSGFLRDAFVMKHLKLLTAAARDTWGEGVEFFLSSEKQEVQNKIKSLKKSRNNPNFPKISSSIHDKKGISLFAPSPSDSFEQEGKMVLHATKNIQQLSKQTDISPDLFTNADTRETSPSSDESTENDISQGHNLIAEMTFSNFVAGSSNRNAHSACLAISKNPGKLNNPLFIYGSTGLGKTHLMNAIGHEISKLFPSWRILYVSTGDIVTDFTASCRPNGRPDLFRMKYRSCDLLLVDDIQFLEKKEQTQTEFFHIFNDLYQSGKQMVLTSDKYPKDIPNIEERLKSRFLQGLITDIEPPGYEDRVAIIEAKSKSSGLKLPKEIIDQIATHVKTNVREIQSVMSHLLLAQQMNGKTPTIDAVNQYLKKILRLDMPPIDIVNVQKAVASHYGLKLHELLSPDRSQRTVVPRHIAMYLAKTLVQNSTLPEIAAAFCRKDHSTVIHALKQINEKINDDQSLRASINEIKRKLEQRPL